MELLFLSGGGENNQWISVVEKELMADFDSWVFDYTDDGTKKKTRQLGLQGFQIPRFPSFEIILSDGFHLGGLAGLFKMEPVAKSFHNPRVSMIQTILPPFAHGIVTFRGPGLDHVPFKENSLLGSM